MLLLDTTDDTIVHIRVLLKPVGSFFKKLRLISQGEFFVAYDLSKREQIQGLANELNEWLERTAPKSTKKGIQNKAKGKGKLQPNILSEVEQSKL